MEWDWTAGYVIIPPGWKLGKGFDFEKVKKITWALILFASSIMKRRLTL